MIDSLSPGQWSYDLYDKNRIIIICTSPLPGSHSCLAFSSLTLFPHPDTKVPSFVFFRLESVSHSQTQPIKLMTLKVLGVHYSSTLALNRDLQFLTTEVDNSVSVGSVPCWFYRVISTWFLREGGSWGEGSGGLTGSPTFPNLWFFPNLLFQALDILCPLSCFINFY